ncbi:zf-HC2 domain-containing protein [Desulfuromonas sp. TF]|uniref:zf-HC2 domain-containing protein n=1 Tax=Desulfuromonas sp. TF TaxID=1232410 RepID=UPI000417CEF1|nr:zf-HC2 domain-containing protein [Desulfuromonas sp. TF]
MNNPHEDSPCLRENMTLFHYGELERADRLGMEKHLQGCSACRRELALLRSTLKILPKREPEFSPGEIRAFNERVVRRIRPRLRQSFRPAFGWSLAATAAVLLMVTLHSPAPAPQQPSQEMALQTDAEIERLPEPELLLNLELLENLDLLQELEETGISG